MGNRLAVLKTVLWALVGVLAAITVVRFTRGLGAVTNLSDAAPWGLWIGFDVMAGVALAAGGFVLAATVYILKLEKYRMFVRPAILTALLGYVAVAVGLLYDLGLPWHIWHPAIYPQHHSVLFEVAMCVMLYLAVLTLEFAPVVLEHPWFSHPLFRKILWFLKRVTIPLVIAGIVLSTLHQSSLGSLFLIAPYRLHPLWYSPIIYVLFFISAVGLGLMTVALESLLAGYFLRHKVHSELLSGLGLAAVGVLGLYTILRIGDLATRGVLEVVLDGSWQSRLFVAELGISAVIPGILLTFKRIRSSVSGVAVCAGLVVFGFVMNRLNICFVAFARPEGAGYFPSWMEVAVSLGIVAGGTLVFLFLVEHFKVYGDEESAPVPMRRGYDPATLRGLLPGVLAGPRRNTLTAVSAAAITFLFLPVGGLEPEATPVARPRTVDGIPTRRADSVGLKLTLAVASEPAPDVTGRRQLLAIDGNRDGTMVLFDHDGHADRLGADTSCGSCHHLTVPFDRNTPCFECHRDMYEPTSLFDHASHVRSVVPSNGCVECHSPEHAVKSYETATACADCHELQSVPGPIIEAPHDRWADAVGYMDAMHDLCITCHERNVQESPNDYSAELHTCAYCHAADRGRQILELTPRRSDGDRATSTRPQMSRRGTPASRSTPSSGSR